jgi:anaerobic selenocysteine-containing dehydrogenase
MFPMLLISGARRSASYNTWTHNLPELAADLRGNWATLAPADATTLGVVEGGMVRIETESGSLEIAVRISPDIRDGVVAVHQFWGHKYDSGTRTSRATPGVNVNLVHDDQTLDRFTGMPVFNGRRCRVAPA